MIQSARVAQMAQAKLALRGPTFLTVPLVLAFCAVESGDWQNPRADYNDAAYLDDRNGGSYGLMQLDWLTAHDRGYEGTPAGLYDPSTNLEYGIRQVQWTGDYLTARGLYSIANVAAGYNEGVGNVGKGRADPDYVARIERALALLAATPNDPAA